MRRRKRFGLVSLGVAGLLGCASTGNLGTGYVPPPPVATEPLLRGGLVVWAWVDQRPPRKSEVSRFFHAVTWIPLLPVASAKYERLDEILSEMQARQQADRTLGATASAESTAASTGYTLARSLARAVAKDLRASGIADFVLFEDEAPALDHIRYELTGVLHDSTLFMTRTTYMLGPAVYALHAFMNPVYCGTTGAVVKATLTLRDRQSDQTLWQYDLDNTILRIARTTDEELVASTHNGTRFSVPVLQEPGVDPYSFFAWHFAALRQGMEAARADLAKTVSQVAATQ